MRRNLKFWVTAPLLFLLACSACTNPTEEGGDDFDCPAELTPVVRVEVRDSVTGVPAADGAEGWMEEDSVVVDSLRITGRDSEGRGVTMTAERPQDPDYLDFWPGTYEVTIQKSGYVDWQSGTFDVPTPGPCPAGQRFEARLVPEP